ncbi:hypothetical protein [Deinococcus sp. UR1]|uniref:hypothetical protein n=1 Tax=Deinococcus sp. UR1 TaxID=1704277 RepID=UPI000C1A6AF6|nr:hypothetical protein [Deinococcus sp. UR1]PIG96666.1 hypothetical protein AMD26_015910 [Deinococcus sp. UR1]
MTLPLLLCALIALTSGLHFGRRFAQAHAAGGALALPALAHGVIVTPLMIMTVLLDPTAAGLLWMTVATAALGGLAVGALRPIREVVPAVVLAPQRLTDTPAQHPAQPSAHNAQHSAA